MDEWERQAQAAMRVLRGTVAALVRDREARASALVACVEAGWTVTDLARELGVTRGTVYRWMMRDADTE